MSTDDFQSFEQKVHDRLAASYPDRFEPVTALAVDALLATSGVSSGGRHADLACGSGIVAIAASARGAVVEAFDISSAMLAKLGERAPSIHAEVASADHLPVDDQHFDTATMSFGIGHLSKPEAAMAELARVLKPGGRVSLSWWADREDNRINGLFVDVIEELALTAPPEILPPGPAIFSLSDPKRWWPSSTMAVSSMSALKRWPFSTLLPVHRTGGESAKAPLPASPPSCKRRLHRRAKLRKPCSSNAHKLTAGTTASPSRSSSM